MRALGVKGATILDSMGSSKYSQENIQNMPRIGGLMRSLHLGVVQNKTIFSVIESKELVEKVADEVEEIIGGSLQKPGTGIMFSVPINMVRGGIINTDKKQNNDDIK